MVNPIRRASLVKPQDEAGKAWPAIAVGFFVAFGGVLFGCVHQSWSGRFKITDLS